MKHIENTSLHTISSESNFLDYISKNASLAGLCIQNIDLSKLEIPWFRFDLKGTTFLGCEILDSDLCIINGRGGIIFPPVDNLPFNPYRDNLYTWQELAEVDDGGKSTDLNTYNWFVERKYNPFVSDALIQRIHDFAIDDALRDLIKPDKNGFISANCVGIMGGHGTNRNDSFFHKVAHLSRALTIQNYCIVSGGGPGIMEAANLGAYFANYSNEELNEAIDILGVAGSYKDDGYTDQSLKVIDMFPDGAKSLAIPTWFYGHEPSNLFASNIAKYFSNSIREDVLLAICLHGVIYAPGSAGTTQEIFMDAAQNHYGSYDFLSPMVFLGEKRYQEQTNLYSTLYSLAAGKRYQKGLMLSDDIDEIVEFIKGHPPVYIK